MGRVVMPTTEKLSSIKWENYNWRKVFPVQEPFWKQEYKADYQTIDFHRRMKNIWGMDVLTGDWVKRERLLSEYFGSFLEIGCRFHSCPLPFNADFYQGGICYSCKYCFSIRTEQSLLSAFFDNWQFGKRRHGNPEVIKERLEDVLSGRRGGVFSYFVKRRIPLRIGNRSENLFFDEERHKITLMAMKLLHDYNYPFIINTKSTLPIKGEWFKMLGECADHCVIQVSFASPYDEMEKRLSPLAYSATERWNVIKTLNEHDIYSVPRFEPMMVTPYDDFRLMIHDFAEKCVESHVKNCFGDVLYYETAPGLNELFSSAGVSFVRELQVASSYGRLIGMALNCASAIFKQYGITYSTLKFENIPFHNHTDCCGVCAKMGDVGSKYNIWRPLRDLVHGLKRRIRFSDLHKENGTPAKQFEKCIREMWDAKSTSQELSFFELINAPGVFTEGVDENHDFIFGYDEKLAYREYQRIIELHGLWGMIS